MKFINIVTKAVAASALLLGSVANATVLNLPDANEMSVGLYNNFNVYSLDLLKKCAADIRCQPQSGIPVASSPGQISDQAIVLQSANGFSNFPTPFAAGTPADDRFLTPTGNQSTSYFMGGAGEPGGKFSGDLTNRWDIRLDVLQTYLDGHELVFLFDNNQSDNRNDSTILLWGQARIVDANGNTVNNLCFELSTNGSGCTDPGANPTPAVGDYVPVISGFCVDKDTGVSYNFGGANNANDCAPTLANPAGGYHVNNNQSTSVGEFAAFNQALHDAAADAANSGYFLSLNIRYLGNNSGAEQLWICSDCSIDGRITDVPEPASLPLVLLGLGIAAVSLLRRRR